MSCINTVIGGVNGWTSNVSTSGSVVINGSGVWINGRKVDPNQQQKEVNQDYNDAVERDALEERFPEFTFEGNCKKIVIEDGVMFEGSATIRQEEPHQILITGETYVEEGAVIENVKSQNCVITGNGSFVFSNVCQNPGKLRIIDSAICTGSTVRGNDIKIDNTTVRNGVSVSAQGSGTLRVKDSELYADVSVSGSGDIKVRASEIRAPLSVAGSGDLEVKNSKIQRSVSVAGSGDIKVTGKSVVNGTLSVCGSGDITIKGSTVNRSESVTGSKSIVYKNGRRR